MPDLTGWTGPVRVEGWRFTDRPPAQPFAHLSDYELGERIRDVFPGLVEAWRDNPGDRKRAATLIRWAVNAGTHSCNLKRYPAVLERRRVLQELVTPEELDELGVRP